MATMMPPTPKECTAASREAELFEALSKLPDDYYVFHSMRIDGSDRRKGQKMLHENEVDFVVFHAQKGILCIEAKAGKPYLDEWGIWHYGSGKRMNGDGPFAQARNNKYALFNRFKESFSEDKLSKCKFLYCVWFPGYTREDVRKLPKLAENASKDLILTSETVTDPQPDIDRIFSYDTMGHPVTNLSEEEKNAFIDRVLCPHFDLFPTPQADIAYNKRAFFRLLKEQMNVLNFLSDQRFAAINGAAGTGKTVIAVRKAMLHAQQEEKVLFLCFNKRLAMKLEKQYANPFIHFCTIDKYACDICHTTQPDYEMFYDKLFEQYMSNRSTYMHIIIDEGQDMAIKRIPDKVIEMLRDIILDHTDFGTFFVFYDERQLIQVGAAELPLYIRDADCRLSLYCNCRNTRKIAETSLTAIRSTNLRRTLLVNADEYPIQEDDVRFYFQSENGKEDVDRIIDSMKDAGYNDIVILTVKTVQTSILKDYVNEQAGKYRNIDVASCREFKGLEADAILLIDIDESTFCSENTDNECDNTPLLFYVGASRARLSLRILADLSNEQCANVLEQYFEDDENVSVSRARKQLVRAMKAHYSAISKQ